MYLHNIKISQVAAGRYALAIAAWENKEAPTSSVGLAAPSSSPCARRDVSTALQVPHINLLVFWERAVQIFCWEQFCGCEIMQLEEGGRVLKAEWWTNLLTRNWRRTGGGPAACSLHRAGRQHRGVSISILVLSRGLGRGTLPAPAFSKLAVFI